MLYINQVYQINMQDQTNKRTFKKAGDMLLEFDIFSGAKYVTKEYQDFGYRLALQLDDLKHKSLYIKLAKEEKRFLLESALRYASDYPKVRNKARIFMWKLKELRKASKKKQSPNSFRKKTS